jgi:hypothetical protein
VWRTVLTYLRPKWLGWHLFAFAAAVGMALLGRWQLDVSDSKGFDLQNFGYTLQWWAFSGFALYFWFKVIRDSRRRPGSGLAPTGGRLVVPTGKAAARFDANTYAGPAYLSTRSDDPDRPSVVYRGYVMPQSATSPTQSDGDAYHGAYNDYLWQLALADGTPPPMQPGEASSADADDTPDGADPPRPRLTP